MGCQPSKSNPESLIPPNVKESTNLPTKPVILTQGFSHYDRRNDGTYQLKTAVPKLKFRRVPRLTDIYESNIMRRRVEDRKIHKIESLPELGNENCINDREIQAENLATSL